MEFIGNRVHIKELAGVCIAAFFAGRINLFDGTFPAAPAFLIVMLAVSTVYIYLLPAVAGAMTLYATQGVFIYGDLLATACLSLFFLFFHQKKFSINQRTAIGMTAIILCNFAAYGWSDMLVLLRPEMLAKEILAFCIYLRAFNTVAKVLYTGRPGDTVSKERVSVALELVLLSFAGAVGIYEIVFALWLLMTAGVLYCLGL